MSGARTAVGAALLLVAGLLCVPLLLVAGPTAGASAAAPPTPTGTQVGHATAVSLAPALPGVPVGGYPTRGFPYGQCTYWAAYNWGGPDHRGVTWSGDAHSWLANAAALGYATARTPSVGAIVVYPAGGAYDQVAGHVAVVVAVTASSYTVSEMHVIGLGRVDIRTAPWPDRVLGFILA